MVKTIIGTMSGTSMDGIDVALLKTDGENIIENSATYSRPYTKSEKALLQNVVDECVKTDGKIRNFEEAETLILKAHQEVIEAFFLDAKLEKSDIDYVAFHGQTVFHAPDKGITVQLGNGELLAKALGIDVIYDFRSNDVQNGGQGAPLVPVYHQALLRKAKPTLPAAMVNIGGVANITILDKVELKAFDTGPGNGPIDDWMNSRTSKQFDQWGRIAGEGSVDEAIVHSWLDNDYFKKASPKSLDRHYFDFQAIDRHSLADGAATLTAFSARAIALALLDNHVKTLYVSGGGAHNRTMMRFLQEASGLSVQFMDALGHDGDFIEAEAFAYLAVRIDAGLAITFPETTGVSAPLKGGKIARA